MPLRRIFVAGLCLKFLRRSSVVNIHTSYTDLIYSSFATLVCHGVPLTAIHYLYLSFNPSHHHCCFVVLNTLTIINSFM